MDPVVFPQKVSIVAAGWALRLQHVPCRAAAAWLVRESAGYMEIAALVWAYPSADDILAKGGRDSSPHFVCLDSSSRAPREPVFQEISAGGLAHFI